MNDGENTRASCDSPYARFASPRPDALAAELESAIEAGDGPERRKAAAASVGAQSWELVADQVEQGLRRGLRLAAGGPASS